MILHPGRTRILAIIAVAALTLPAIIPRGYMPHMDGHGKMSIQLCMGDLCPFATASAPADNSYHSPPAFDPVCDVTVVRWVDTGRQISCPRPPLPARGPPPKA